MKFRPILKMNEADDTGGAGGGGSGGADDKSKEVFNKILSEKKKVAAENLELKSKLQDYEQKQLEADGKLKEANENLKKLLGESKAEKETLAKTVTSKVLFQQFAREAEKLGCVDVKMAYGAVDLSDVDVTADLELDTTKLQEKLANLSKDKSFLFKKDIQETKDLNLSEQKKGQTSNSLDNVKTEDLIKMLATAK